MRQGKGYQRNSRRIGKRFVGGATVALTLMVPGAAPAIEKAAETPGIACTVSGYDVIIHNRGTEQIASGTSVDWSVPFLRKEGNNVLAAVLEPGGRVFLSGVLAGGGFLDPSKPCEANETIAVPAG